MISAMDYDEFLAEIIGLGIVRAMHVHDGLSANKTFKRNGAIAGFEACRAKTPEELNELEQRASKAVREAYQLQADDYWYWRCYESEIEWVSGCVAAMQLITQSKTSGTVTTRHMEQAHKVLEGAT